MRKPSQIFVSFNLPKLQRPAPEGTELWYEDKTYTIDETLIKSRDEVSLAAVRTSPTDMLHMKESSFTCFNLLWHGYGMATINQKLNVPNQSSFLGRFCFHNKVLVSILLDITTGSWLAAVENHKSFIAG